MKKYETIGGPLKSVDDIVIPEPTEKPKPLDLDQFLKDPFLRDMGIFGVAYLFGRLTYEGKKKK